jgi:hypothetical protein
MTFSDTADGRVARHLPQGVEAVGQEQGRTTHTGGGKRRLGPRVSPADYNNIIFINDLHN